MPPDKGRRVGKDAAPGEIYFEFVTQGAYVKVTAIDAATGVEASIVGAAGAGQATLERNALAKLRYVMAKRKAPSP